MNVNGKQIAPAIFWGKFPMGTGAFFAYNLNTQKNMEHIDNFVTI